MNWAASSPAEQAPKLAQRRIDAMNRSISTRRVVAFTAEVFHQHVDIK
jgi:hypothetical protein